MDIREVDAKEGGTPQRTSVSPQKQLVLHDTNRSDLLNGTSVAVDKALSDNEHTGKPDEKDFPKPKTSPSNPKTEPSQLSMSVGKHSDDTKLQNGTGSYGKNGQIPQKGKFVKRIEDIKYIKEVSVTEQYYEDGVLRFSHPPEIQRKETAPSTHSVTVTECSDEAFKAGEMRSKKQRSSRNTKSPSVVKETVEDKFQEPGNSSTTDDEIGRGKRPRVMTLLSEDDEEEPEKVSEKKQRSREPETNEKFSKGKYVLAKYNDNNYYPAQIIGKDAQSSRWRVVFMDSKEEEQIHETDLLIPSAWLTMNRLILIKAGSAREGGEYENAVITQLHKEEGKAPRYTVKLQESKESKTVNLAEVAVEADEVLREKFGNGSSTDKNAGSKPELDEGTVVFGQWTDGSYYAGKITSFSTKAKQYNVEFLDNETATLPVDQVVLADEMVKPDTTVQVKVKNGYEKGTIISVTGSGDTIEAVVKFGASRQDNIHISELVFDKSEVKRVQKGKPAKKDADSGSIAEIPQRSRQSTRLSTASPPKPKPEKTPTAPKAKPEPKSASKPKSAKKEKAKVVEEMIIDDEHEDEDDNESRKSVESDKNRTHQIGKTAFKHKEEVFGKWEDGRWYAAWVIGTRQSKFHVSWCENTQKNSLTADDIIKASDILEEGLRVNVIVDGKAYYDEVTFEKRMEEGPHLVKSKKKQVIEKKFEEMMIQNDEVARWRKKPLQKTPTTSKDGTSLDKETPSKAAGAVKPSSSAKPSSSVKASSPKPSVEKSIKKRARSSSIEEDAKSPGKRTAAKAPSPLVEESPPRETQGPPLAQCSFIITSGGEKDATFDRDYIVTKVTELGGSVLNTFDDLINVAGKRFLISPGPCRTAKFLQCLAANFPCVSHKWIFEVADKNKWVDYAKHRLKTGKSSTEAGGKMVEWAPRKVLLDNVRIALYGGSPFRSTWVPALRMAKATPTVLEEQDADSNMKRFDVVVVEDRAPPELITNCKQDGIPVTTVEWIIQTLIHGKKLEYGNWPYSEGAGDA